MRIFYIGDFNKFYSTEVYIAYGLEEAGNKVFCYQNNAIETPESVIDRVNEFKPDFVLFAKSQFNSKNLSIINKLKEIGILTVSWNFDLYFNLPPELGGTRTKDSAVFFCDIIIATDGGEYGGVPHETLRQGIHSPDAHFGRADTGGGEIVFVGSNSYIKRALLLGFLRKTYGNRFVHVGGRSEVRGEKLNDIVTSAKIVVGDSVPSDNYWSNRIYEMLGRGAFLIHPKVEGLDKEFTYYKHFVPFDYGHFAQLKMIIDYYLVHDKEREAIRSAGHWYCKNNYTYTKRAEQLINIVQRYALQSNRATKGTLGQASTIF